MQPTCDDAHAFGVRVSRECRLSADAARIAIQRSHEAIAGARIAMQRTHAAIDRSAIALRSAVSRVVSQSALLR